jgi:hypothetical protein
VDVKQVGRELGVRYILEGSVRKASGRMRISGQLIDTSTAAHLWADRFEGGQALPFEEMALRERPNYILPTLVTAASNSLVGRRQDAEKTMAKARRLTRNCAYPILVRGI